MSSFKGHKAKHWELYEEIGKSNIVVGEFNHLSPQLMGQTDNNCKAMKDLNSTKSKFELDSQQQRIHIFFKVSHKLGNIYYILSHELKS